MSSARCLVTLALALSTRAATAQPTFGSRSQVVTEPELTPEDEELLRRALADPSEVIEIWGERPDKPFDRDTEARLTGEELVALGATDLATALALLPDVSVRDVGRGGFNVDVRGARKGAVRILIDGVSVSDPYYGTFDVSTIPVTDIAQIRVSTAPASPIDGPGGPGGVIEVHTRDAVGGRLVVGRMTGDTAPTFGASATGRAPLTEHLALRLSLSSVLGLERYETAIDGEGSVEDPRRSATGALRLEYRDGDRRAVIDGFADLRRYLSPPSDELASALLLMIDREATARASAAYDDRLAFDPSFQIQGQAWFAAMSRRSRNYRDVDLSDQASAEELHAVRAGGMVLATRPIGPRWRWVASFTLDHDRARVDAESPPAPPRATRGDSTITETSAGAQFEDGPVKIDGAAGLAAPIGLGADPWPEAKLSVRYRPHRVVELTAIGARKGRVPSLRERYEGADANPSLDPEMAWHGELKTTVRPHVAIELSAAPYLRRTTGTVKLDPDDGVGLLNLGELNVRGVDVSARARLPGAVELGAAYEYARAHSDDLGANPLDRFPEHRVEGWAKVAPLPQLTALARVRHIGEAFDREVATPAYFVCDASITARLHEVDWLGVLRMDDVFDERPETRVGYRLPGRTVSLTLQGTWD